MKKELGCLNIGAKSEYCQEFTLTELRKALGKMKRKGTPGPDDIPPPFLQELGPKAQKELLGIFNASLLEEKCPQTWRREQ